MRALKGAAFCAMAFFAAAQLQGQSARRGGGFARMGSSPSEALLFEITPKDNIYILAGRVVAVENGGIIVNLGTKNLTAPDGWTNVYYTCDAAQTPKAIVKPTGQAHKSCAVFSLENGTAAVGDLLMVRQSPIEKPQQ